MGGAAPTPGLHGRGAPLEVRRLAVALLHLEAVVTVRRVRVARVVRREARASRPGRKFATRGPHAVRVVGVGRVRHARAVRRRRAETASMAAANQDAAVRRAQLVRCGRDGGRVVGVREVQVVDICGAEA